MTVSLGISGNSLDWIWPSRRLGSAARRRGTEPAVDNDRLCDLIEAVATQRDRQAFSELFRHFAPRLKAFGLRLGSDQGAAEELAQEAMLILWRKADTFDRSRATAATWVYTIVRNKRIDMFRRENRPEVALDEAEDQAADVEPADDRVWSLQVGGTMREAIVTLPAEQRQVIEKAFFEDKSHSVIAAELDLPLGTVKSRIRLALSRMRMAFPEE